MNAKTIIHTSSAPAPVGPYNQAVLASGKLLFISGQIALDPETQTIVGEGDIVQQTQQVMKNLSAILTAGGTNWENVIKVTIFLKDITHFGVMNEVYANYFKLETAPARACVEVSRLPKDVLVEIECTALVP